MLNLATFKKRRERVSSCWLWSWRCSLICSFKRRERNFKSLMWKMTGLGAPEFPHQCCFLSSPLGYKLPEGRIWSHSLPYPQCRLISGTQWVLKSVHWIKWSASFNWRKKNPVQCLVHEHQKQNVEDGSFLKRTAQGISLHAAMRIHCRLGHSHNRNSFSHSSAESKSKIRVPKTFGFWGGLSAWLVDGCLPLVSSYNLSVWALGQRELWHLFLLRCQSD